MGTPDGGSPKLSARESVRAIARAAALCELTFGAFHAMNNAFTAIVGEASYLQGEHKDAGQVDESCDVILEQVERCARMTRALLLRRPAPLQSGGDCDLVRVIRDVEPLLRDALSRRVALAVETPEEPLLVDLDPVDVETLVVLLVQRAARAGAGSVQVTLRARAGEAEEAWLEIGVTPEGAASSSDWRSTSPAAPLSTARLGDGAIDALVELLGARSEARAGERELATRVRLARMADA